MSNDCACGHLQHQHGNVAPYRCMQGLWTGGQNFVGDYLGVCPCENYLGEGVELWETERKFRNLTRGLDGEDLLGYEDAGDRDFWLSATAAGYRGPESAGENG